MTRMCMGRSHPQLILVLHILSVLLVSPDPRPPIPDPYNTVRPARTTSSSSAEVPPLTPAAPTT